jgi:hypothetical protein
VLAHEAFVGMPCSRGASTPPHVCSLYLIDCYILIPADAELVIVLSDTDGVDELFFGPEGIVKGLCSGAVVLIRSTMLPSHLEKLNQKLAGRHC